jgi:hypothetical protein
MTTVTAPVYAMMALMGVLMFAAVAAAYWAYRVGFAKEKYYRALRLRERLGTLKQLREASLKDSAKLLAKKIDEEIKKDAEP